MRNRILHGTAVALSALLLFWSAATGQTSIHTISEGPELDVTKSLVVMIEGKLDGAPTQGAGFVFAVEGGWTHVVTAYHLVRQGDRRATDLTIRFWQNQQETFPAELYKDSFGDDLAVLRVKGPQAAVEFRRLADLEQLKTSQPVYAIGHPNDKGPWNVTYQPLTISDIEKSHLRVQSQLIEEGFSGGPLIDEHKLLIGMVLAAGDSTAKVVRIDRIAEVLRRDLNLTVELSGIPSSRITVDDGSTNSFSSVASNDPKHGNVWYSLAQTFKAPYEHVRFGFKLRHDPGDVPSAGTAVIYNLYAGENSYSKLLASKTVTLPGTRNSGGSRAGDMGFVFAEFSNVNLIIGQSYTVEIRVPALPSVGSSSPIGVWVSGKDPYRHGRFYLPPASPTSVNNAFFAGQDLLFEVVARPGVVTYELNMRLSDGGSVSGHFKFDNDAAMDEPGPASDRFTACLVDYDIKVSGGNTSAFPELRYTPANSRRSVIGRDDGPGFPIYAFDLSHMDAKSEGRLLAIRWTTPKVLPTTADGEVRLTTWGGTPFGLANQQCYDCAPQRQALVGSLRVTQVK